MSDQLNFNLKLFRERITDKYQRNSSNTKIGYDIYFSNQRKSFKTNAPTLDSLSSRLQNSSINKFKTDSRICSPKHLASPVTINGMQQKIKSITTSPQQFVNNHFGHPLKSPQSVVTPFQGFYQSPRAQTDRNEFQEIKRYNSNNDITEMVLLIQQLLIQIIRFINFLNLREQIMTKTFLANNIIKIINLSKISSSIKTIPKHQYYFYFTIPLNDLVNLRSKLENCDINAAHISPTYLSEIVKLAHIINTQLQKK